MSIFFTLLFLATLVGIIKPYIPNLERKHFIAAAIVSLVLIGIFTPKSGNQPPAPPYQEMKPTTQNTVKAPAETTESNVPTHPASKWHYSEKKDEMRGTTAKFAELRSENEVNLDFPYGSVNGIITVRKRPQDGLNIMFSVDNGQILCRSFGDTTYVSAKFDDGPIKRYACTGTSDGSSETAFIEHTVDFLANLKKAKRTIIEAELYNNGREQFTFDTAGLDWK
ncbi:MAG: hypothetical protein EP321_09655 [Sphingomonadales bacterium]|nr:MAG: hypothetical protein EP345_18985 [Sphingomonadales bacterium]TNF03748.1 MAG: hypothetical protein EP321_09655 [Sphingomonadales bacterium]